MTEDYSKLQPEAHSPADADNGRPLFKAYNPATGEFVNIKSVLVRD